MAPRMTVAAVSAPTAASTGEDMSMGASQIAENVSPQVVMVTGNLKTKVKTSFAAMQSVLQLCGFNATTGEINEVTSFMKTFKELKEN